MEWNFGDILDVIERTVDPQRLAFAHGDRTLTFKQAGERSNRLARNFAAAGVRPGDKVAHYMRNHPAYMESVRAGFKGRFTHVNINYRYKPDEVAYIIENSDAAVLVYGAEFRDTVAAIRDRLPLVRLYVEVDGGADKAPFAQDFETLAISGDSSPLDIERSGDDQLLLYTGGTTGMPKGVIWPHKELRELALVAARKAGLAAPDTIPELIDALTTGPLAPPMLPACPLMHGTGLFSAIAATMNGAAIVTLEGATFDPHDLWRAVDRWRVGSIVIVGDAFAKPLLRALDDKPGFYDLACVVNVVSSGVMWSVETKRGLLEHMPQAMMTDSFGSSEAVGLGSAIMIKQGEIPTARFTIGDRAQVFDENDEPIVPGSGKQGLIAMASPLPLGYYKDEAKTAKTFRTIRGKRYSIPGDFCMVEADGTIVLLGRGSATINTAGEKVFPEEVEEALKTHPSIEDALVIGVPDEKWGQAITAVVKTAPGFRLQEADLVAHVKDKLAAYKSPKRVLLANGFSLRAPNGKADYKTATAFARETLAV
jgi:fatty-acyl-CoA synthase